MFLSFLFSLSSFLSSCFLVSCCIFHLIRVTFAHFSSRLLPCLQSLQQSADMTVQACCAAIWCSSEERTCKHAHINTGIHYISSMWAPTLAQTHTHAPTCYSSNRGKRHTEVININHLPKSSAFSPPLSSLVPLPLFQIFIQVPLLVWSWAIVFDASWEVNAVEEINRKRKVTTAWICLRDKV